MLSCTESHRRALMRQAACLMLKGSFGKMIRILFRNPHPDVSLTFASVSPNVYRITPQSMHLVTWHTPQHGVQIIRPLSIRISATPYSQAHEPDQWIQHICDNALC